jgi:hypothetical protein
VTVAMVLILTQHGHHAESMSGAHARPECRAFCNGLVSLLCYAVCLQQLQLQHSLCWLGGSTDCLFDVFEMICFVDLCAVAGCHRGGHQTLSSRALRYRR